MKIVSKSSTLQHPEFAGKLGFDVVVFVTEKSTSTMGTNWGYRKHILHFSHWRSSANFDKMKKVVRYWRTGSSVGAALGRSGNFVNHRGHVTCMDGDKSEHTYI